jgi:hypothetical protein
LETAGGLVVLLPPVLGPTGCLPIAVRQFY